MLPRPSRVELDGHGVGPRRGVEFPVRGAVVNLERKRERKEEKNHYNMICVVNMVWMNVCTGAAAYQLGNTSSRTITGVKQC